MSILSYNGGSIVAMRGDGCVAIATDKRFGSEGHALSSKFQRLFQFGPRLFVGLPGLGTDTKTVHQRLRFRVNMYELRENRRIQPKTMSSLISSFLYEKRFGPYFVEPIVAGLDEKTGEPFIDCMDSLGQPSESSDGFAVAGTCAEQSFGLCETLWEPNMNPDQLVEATAQALINACGRDAASGWGVTVYLVEKDAITIKEVKTRMD